jgi:hypothetical protein
MAKPPQYRAVPDHSGKPLHSGKVGVSFDSFEPKTNQANIHNTRPTRGGEILHHQITLENHCKAERLEFF